MKNILVVSESIDIEDSSGSKVNVSLIYNLKKIGYNVRILHYTRKNIQLGNEIECISIPEIKFSFNYVLSRTQRVFQRITKINVSIFLESIFGNSFTFFNDSKSITKAIEKYYNNEELIITLSKGASFRPHYAMLRLVKLHNVWMANIHDPFPFHYYPRPYNYVQSGYRFKESFFRKVSEKSRYSVFPSLMLKNWMGSYFSNFLKTGIVIPHQNISISNIDDINYPSYFEERKFMLLHAGNLMNERPPNGLIEGYKLFLKNNEEAITNSKLILLGDAHDNKEYLLSEINDTIYWSKKSVNFSEVQKIQNTVSVNIILESISEISPFLPGKFPHCISANKPILLLGPHYSESKRLLGNDYEFVSEANDIIKIAFLIERLYFNWKLNKNQKLDRKDLEKYVGLSFLKNTFNNI